MRLCLVAAATVTEYESFSDAVSAEVKSITNRPHLGPLTLAAVIEPTGLGLNVLSLNDSYYEYLASGGEGADEFASWVISRKLPLQADVYGFSSICSTYPLSIRIAQALKQNHPDCTIVFGGPQASVVDVQTLEAFPFVDFVLRGEADESLPLFLDELAGRRQFEKVPGLTFRSPFGPARNGSAPLIRDLDTLPLPAFHLVGDLTDVEMIPLEIGRGCPYACTFCSTNDFFRRKFRLKSPQRLLADMQNVAAAYGVTAFELTHDMFTVDRRKVVEFCEYLIKAGSAFKWNCSARTDSLDEELLELMAAAGCGSVFLGVESGSPRMQKIFGKNLDISEARNIITSAERVGVVSTVSLIVGFPEETWDDTRETMNMYFHSLRHANSNPQLNVLSPLADTPVYRTYRESLMLEELCSDMSHQGRSQNGADRELIRQYPEIFPNFYLLPVPHLDREWLLEFREFVLTTTPRLRWLLVALHRAAGHILDVFNGWREYRMRIHPELKGWALREYYIEEISRQEFLAFLRQLRPEALAPEVDCLLSYHELSRRAMEHQPETPTWASVSDPQPDDIPIRRPRTCIFELSYDVHAILDSLKSNEPLVEIDRTPRWYRTEKRSGIGFQLIETRPLIAAALEVCDGTNTVSNFNRKMSDVIGGPERAKTVAAQCLLNTLQQEGLVNVYRPPARAESANSVALAS